MSGVALQRGGQGCLYVSGRLDFATVGELWWQGLGLLGACSGEVYEVDLGGVGRTDSAGVALLIDWARYAHEAGGHLRLRHVPQQMLAILRASGVEAILDIADERKTAS